MDATADGIAGFVMFMTCIASSTAPAARTSMCGSVAATCVSRTPSSASNPPTPSRMDATADGMAGFVTFMICIASSTAPAASA